MRTTRREFVGVLGAAALKAASVKPDLILYNAAIHTMDPANPLAESVAISGGRFLVVGTNQEVANLPSAGVKRIDIGGHTVVPGFIDGHLHFASSGLSHLREVDCDLGSIAAVQAAIRKRAAEVGPGKWVGFKFDDTKTKEGRGLRKADLDAVAPDNPVAIDHRGGHSTYVNSRALALVDVNEKSPDPPGGRYERDAEGRLTGRLQEDAAGPLRAKVDFPATRAERQAGVALLSKMLTRAGLTSVDDPGIAPEALTAYQDAYDAGELTVRVYACIWQGKAVGGPAYIKNMLAAGVRSGLGNEWVRVGAQKLLCDGSISERTAYLSQPYIGRPNDHGILVANEEELYEAARPGHLAGWQTGIHANGDVAIDIVLKVYERLQREAPRKDPRYRIEHCVVINDDLVGRIKAQGVIPLPFSTYVYYHGEKMKEYGPERLNHMFALRSFIDAGIRPTIGSDYVPGPFEPMMFLQSAVTRTDTKGTVWGPKQRITVDEAIRVGTINGAYASYEEKLKGSIEIGKLADLVVLGRDPYKSDPSTLVNIPIERTMVGGEWKYEA